MNHIYRLVWNRRLNTWVVASELARGRKKGTARTSLLVALTLAAAAAQAAPNGGQVTAGSGQITSSGNTTTITQSSQSLSLSWQSFNIAPQETVNFLQPSTTAVALNRINDTNGTQILGHLTANGQIYLINPNGILFGKGAQVDVGGLVATTLDNVSSSMGTGTPGSSTLSFSGNGTGTISNQGTITAVPGGYVALLANSVRNDGTITAQMGSVALGAGSAVTLTFAGSSLAGLQVDSSALQAQAANGGLIQADGGRVIMTAGAQDALLASVVNNTGVIEARTVEDHQGTITLLGGMSAGQVNVGGTLDASAPNGGNGGTIETSATQVSVAPDARVTTAAPQGLAGTWFIDPSDFDIAPSGGALTGSQVSGYLAEGNLTFSAPGNINVDDTISWSASTTLTLQASNNITVNKNITATGAIARLILQPGTGNGSTFSLNNGAVITLSGSSPWLSISGQTYTVINSLGIPGGTTGLEGMAANLSGYYALGSDINAGATEGWIYGFSPIGGGTAFSGTFNGLGHTINGLSVTSFTQAPAGLFGASSGTITNVGLTGVSIYGQSASGGLVGSNSGTISNSYVTGNVTGWSSAGGLVGVNAGTISNSYSTAQVVSENASAGGLIGENSGSLTNTYATGTVFGGTESGGLVGWNHASGTITNSYATGQIELAIDNAGGLVGENDGAITNAYATGDIFDADQMGGLVGTNTGTVANVYSTGQVADAWYPASGLIGSNTGTVTNGYWNTTTAELFGSSGGAGTGLTTGQMTTASNFTGFNFTSTPGASGNNWVIVDANGTLNNSSGVSGATYPVLASEYSTSIGNAHQLQLMAMAPGASYQLGTNIDASVTGTVNDVWVGGGGFVPIGGSVGVTFTGSFNGQGHTISGLSVNAGIDDAGLFGNSSGMIQNVGVVGGSVSGSGNVGALVGQNSGTVNNSYATATVSGSMTNVGGLVGENTGTVTNSYATGRVNGSMQTGGLVGTNSNSGTVTSSYATGAVSGTQETGGLVGENDGSIASSYATGAVSGQDDVGGLIGTNNETVSGVYATGAVTGVSGADALGGLIGTNGGTVASAYATGAVTGASGANALGGLIGVNSGAFTNAYATGAVTGSSEVGGLIGLNYGNVTNAYATGAVSGSLEVGGLIGLNSGPVTNTYSTGAVSGSIEVGGLIGSNGGATVTNSYWDTDTSGTTMSAAGTGLSTALMQQQTSFNGWDFANTWLIYNGYTDPLLLSFMTPLTVTAGNVTETYNASAYSGGPGVSYSLTPNASLLLGSLTYSGSAQGAVNVGSYTISPVGLYSSQQGYAITYVGGTLTIKPATLTVTGTNVSGKTYDGTTTATLSGGSLLGVMGSDVVTLTQAGNFSTANVGTGISVAAADSLSGTAAGNYTLVQPIGLSADITPKSLTVTGTTVNSKVYDGGTAATLTDGALSGVVGSDAVALTQAGNFATANAGAGIAVAAADSLSGTAAGNYTLVQPIGLSADITPKSLTVMGTTVNSKVYDGSTAATLTDGALSGVVGSDAVTLSQAGNFSTANAGAGIAVAAADSLSGTAAGNYTLVQPIGLSADITPKSLTVTGTTVNSKVYDGSTAATLTDGALSGVVGSDAVTLSQAGNFSTANAGVGIAVTATDSLGGTAASNYTLEQPIGLSADITPKALTVTGTNVSNKVYDGTTTANLSGGALSGVVTSDLITLTQAGNFASDNAGSGISVTATDSLGGAAARNYILVQPTGLTGTITPATLMYVAGSRTVVAGNGPSGLIGMVTGFVPGDTLANSTSGTLEWTTTATANTSPGTYAIDGDGLTASNYVFTQATGNETALTIFPAVMTTPAPVAGLQASLKSNVVSINTIATSGGNVGFDIENDGVRLPDDAVVLQ